MNRRRFLGAVLGTVLLVGATIPATATARGPQRAERIPMPSGKLATKVKPGLFGDKTSTVLIELTGKPVALRQADAQTTGRTLSRAQRATFRAQIKATQDALRGRISATGAKVVSQFQDAINGIKVRATGKEIA